MQHPMKNTPNMEPIRNMFGPLKTQSWARETFPILVNRAQNGQVITFKELAKDYFGVKGFMIFGHVCGSISATLYELERDWSKGHIPRITNLVVRSDAKVLAGFVAEVLTGDRNTPPEVSEYIEIQLKPIWEYSDWDKVKTELDLKDKIYDAEI